MAQFGLWLSAGEAAAARLEAAMAATSLTCVFIEGKVDGAVRPLVELAQKRSVAAVLVDQVALAKRVGADGVHLSAGDNVLERLAAARKALGENAIVGATCGGSRHMAMEIGETGAEYVAFGLEDEQVGAIDPDDDDTEDDDTEFEDRDPPMSRAGLVLWWSTLFEVPCVALDVRPDDADVLSALGEGDFAVWHWPAGLSIEAGVGALRTLARGLAELEA